MVHRTPRRTRLLVGAGSLTLVVGGLALAGGPSAAAPPPTADPVPILGSGLGLGLQAVVNAAEAPAARRTTRPLLDPTALVARDGRGRVRVSLTPQSDERAVAFRTRAERAGLEVTAVDPALGTLEGYVAPDDVRALQALDGVGTLALSPRPQAATGSVTGQGTALQRADRVLAQGSDGTGITVGALSDSYDTAPKTVDGDPLTIRAADDVASGDLPGIGNTRHPDPVVVVQEGSAEDAATSVDEGRAMLQLVHDTAPGARLCFATAFDGLVGFAENVRRLADPASGCGADVVVDDVGYFEEPFYSDSVLSDAIDDVAATGVHYFSSAGNYGAQQAWEGPLRLQQGAAARAAAKRAGLDLSDVPPEVYAGGLLDLDQGSAVDVATDLSVGPDGSPVSLKWDDPTDLAGATISDPWYSAAGAVGAVPSTFTLAVPEERVGQQALVTVDGVPSGSTDVVVSVTAPDGTVSGPVDTGTSPETLGLTLAEAGDYTIEVAGFDETSTGPFTVEVAQILAPSKVTTDLSLLFFDTDGELVAASDDDNLLTGRPLELNYLADGEPRDLQLVVARSTTGTPAATRAQVQVLGDAVLTEDDDPLAPSSVPHSFARGASGVAAYGPFRPFQPEVFTSPGGTLPVRFDSAGEPLASVELRRTPTLAGADGGNTTFFGSDSLLDADTAPNFFGTSAAAPQAAAVAALLLDATGGARSLTPQALRTRLQRTAVTHDLDPALSEGRARGVRLVARGGQGSEGLAAPPSAMVDDRFFRLRYSGRVPLRRITLYGETASPTALGARAGQPSAGIVFDPRRLSRGEPGNWSEAGFRFRVGAAYGGLRTGSVQAAYSRPTGTGQFRRMTVSFGRGLARGQGVDFGVDRDLAVSRPGKSSQGNGADELGGAVVLPSGKVLARGLRFTAVRADGVRITGYLRNDLGRGWTALDGAGLIDAEAAVSGR